MRGIKLTEKNGKITHFLNAEHHYKDGNIVIVKYDVNNVETDKHYIPKDEVKEIKYE